MDEYIDHDFGYLSNQNVDFYFLESNSFGARRSMKHVRWRHDQYQYHVLEHHDDVDRDNNMDHDYSVVIYGFLSCRYRVIRSHQ